MPKIQRSSNDPKLNVGATPRISIPEMGTGAAAKSAQAQKETLRAIEQAEDTIIKIRDFRETTEASNYAFERLNEIKSASESDIGFDTIKYDTEIDKVGSEAAKTITGQLAQEEFMANFQTQATSTKWGIKNSFRKRELRSIDASINYQGEQIADSFGAMNDAEKISSVANYRKSLENGFNIGLYDKGTVNAKYADFQQKVIEGKIEWDIFSDVA